MGLVSDPIAFHSLLKSETAESQRCDSTDSVKVKGLSNYECKLISPLLTKYGFDKKTHQVKLLSSMGKGEIFDCSHLSDRSFFIEEQNISIPGYGRDDASQYLKETLEKILLINDNIECLVPIHADGDGHCLVHALSRALVGYELFWHALLTHLNKHFKTKKEQYKRLFSNFIEDSEWNDIIAETEPNFSPKYGEIHGMRNIHIFGLANILHRPVILLDSLEGMQSKADYSAVFLPSLQDPCQCRNSDGILNKPVVIAWSSRGRNHFVPLVGVAGKKHPKFPKYLLPKVWGTEQALLQQYFTFENDACEIGGKRSLSESFLLKLVDAMRKHFRVLNNISPTLVTDVYAQIMCPSGVTGISSEDVTEAVRIIVVEERLYQCLVCLTLVEIVLPCPVSWLQSGGMLFESAKQLNGDLKEDYLYKFPDHPNLICSYNKQKDKLQLVQRHLHCKKCKGAIRAVNPDGSLVYFNGDRLDLSASGQ